MLNQADSLVVVAKYCIYQTNLKVVLIFNTRSKKANKHHFLNVKLLSCILCAAFDYCFFHNIIVLICIYLQLFLLLS